MGLLLGETLADAQQWAFQTKKHRLLAQSQKSGSKTIPAPYAKGFLSTGLFAFSRHPNFFCEILLWWAVYAFSVAVVFIHDKGLAITETLVNWTLVGPVLLTVLFQASAITS